MKRAAQLVTLLVPLGVFAAPSKQVMECVQASEAAQTARDELKFNASRQQLKRCMASTCPSLVQTDCAKWLTQLDADQPSVVIAVRKGGVDVADGFSIEVDGAAVEARPGEAVRIDPGARAVTVRLADRSSTQNVVAVVGEKNRKMQFEFVDLEPRADVVAVPAVVNRPIPAAVPSPALPVTLTAATAVSFATFAVLGALGNGALQPVASSPCAATRTCAPSSLEPARGFYLAADVALVAGVVLAGVSIWRWIAFATP